MSRDDYRNMNLREVDFSGKDLDGSDFQNADLTGALLIGASLRNCNFTGANLEGAVLAFADVEGAVFDDCILKDAILFDTTTLVSGDGPEIFAPKETGPIRAIVLNQFDDAFGHLVRYDDSVNQYLDLLVAMTGLDMFEVDTPFVERYDDPEYVTIAGFGSEDNQALLSQGEKDADNMFTAVISQNDHPLRMFCGFAWMTDFANWREVDQIWGWHKSSKFQASCVGSTLIDCTLRFLSKTAAGESKSAWVGLSRYNSNLSKYLRCSFKAQKSRGWLPLDVSGGSFEDCSFTGLRITGETHVDDWVTEDLESPQLADAVKQWLPTFSNVQKVEFRGCVFRNVKFMGVKFKNVRFIDCVFTGRTTFNKECTFDDAQAINCRGIEDATIEPPRRGQPLTILP